MLAPAATRAVHECVVKVGLARRGDSASDALQRSRMIMTPESMLVQQAPGKCGAARAAS